MSLKSSPNAISMQWYICKFADPFKGKILWPLIHHIMIKAACSGSYPRDPSWGQLGSCCSGMWSPASSIPLSRSSGGLAVSISFKISTSSRILAISSTSFKISTTSKDIGSVNLFHRHPHLWAVWHVLCTHIFKVSSQSWVFFSFSVLKN